jgi:hypothetical protein
VPVPVLRVARPSGDLQPFLKFYRDGLGLALLYRFEDHDGYRCAAKRGMGSLMPAAAICAHSSVGGEADSQSAGSEPHLAQKRKFLSE